MTTGQRSTLREFTSFAVVGGTGFAVDAALFLMLNSFMGWTVAWARVVSATCSMTTTWTLNRRLTFHHRKSPDARSEYIRYLVTQTLGLAVNISVFAACLATSDYMRDVPFVALLVGATVALGFNFFTARTFAFRST